MNFSEVKTLKDAEEQFPSSPQQLRDMRAQISIVLGICLLLTGIFSLLFIRHWVAVVVPGTMLFMALTLKLCRVYRESSVKRLWTLHAFQDPVSPGGEVVGRYFISPDTWDDTPCVRHLFDTSYHLASKLYHNLLAIELGGKEPCALVWTPGRGNPRSGEWREVQVAYESGNFGYDTSYVNLRVQDTSCMRVHASFLSEHLPYLRGDLAITVPTLNAALEELAQVRYELERTKSRLRIAANIIIGLLAGLSHAGKGNKKSFKQMRLNVASTLGQVFMTPELQLHYKASVHLGKEETRKFLSLDEIDAMERGTLPEMAERKMINLPRPVV